MKNFISKTVIILGLLLCVNGLSAQVPGLVGKRLALNYDLVLTPSFGQAIPYNSAEKKERSFLNNNIRYRHEAELEFAVSRKLSFGAYYLYHRGGYGARDIEYGFSNVSQFGDDPESYNANFSRNFIRHGVGLSMKKYIVSLLGYSTDDGAFAPLGSYWGPKVFMSFDRYQVKANSDTYGGKNLIFRNEQLTHYGAGIKTGRHVLLFDRLMMDIGFEMGFILLNNEIDQAGNGSNLTMFFLDSPMEHPFDHISINHFFGIHLGLSYVLF